MIEMGDVEIEVRTEAMQQVEQHHGIAATGHGDDDVRPKREPLGVLVKMATELPREAGIGADGVRPELDLRLRP